MKARKILVAVFAVLGLLYTIVSCKDDDEQLEVPYLFRPVAFAAETNKTVVTITWAAVKGATSYTLQISKDSLLFENIVISDTLTECSYVVELAGDTRYSARIRANAGSSEKDSKYNDKLTFKTPAENIFTGYTSFMNGQGSALAKWLPASNVTQLQFKAAGLDAVSFTITDDEKKSGKKVCEGLANGTYTVGIYNNDILRGTEEIVIEGDYFVNKGDNLATVMNSITQDGAVVVLQPGTYNLGSTSFSITKGFKLRGLYSDTLSVVCMSGASSSIAMFTINTTSTLNFLRFQNIELSAYLDGGTSGTRINYLFNQGTACNITELTLSNCIVRNFGNSVVRLQQASTTKKIGTLTFDNCRIFDIGNASVYGIVNTNVAGSTIDNISFTNCTAYNFTGPLILHNIGNSNSINIENCTFNQMVTSGTGTTIRYFIDYTTTYEVTNGITVKNCIFGSTSTAYTEGIRVSSSTNKQIAGSYYTSDYDDNSATLTYSFVGSMTSYSGSSADLFTAPASGDFTFKDKSFAGRSSAGDPRWWPTE
jgi:hypothetical protein